MSHYPYEKAISIRMKKLPPLPRGPRMSQQPWEGFTPNDSPRFAELPVCPQARCRRAKECRAAHDNLYCQRTHFSPAEQKKWRRLDPYQRVIDAMPPVAENAGMAKRAMGLLSIQAVQLERAMAMTERWKAGEFDHLYGPYRRKGVLMRPPEKTYKEPLSRRSPE